MCQKRIMGDWKYPNTQHSEGKSYKMKIKCHSSKQIYSCCKFKKSVSSKPVLFSMLSFRGSLKKEVPSSLG